MIQLKQRGTGSWLDPRSSKSLAAKLSTRLVERCRGEKGVVVTLTYRREEFGDSRELYRAAQEEQHVPLFLRKVSRHLGESLMRPGGIVIWLSWSSTGMGFHPSFRRVRVVSIEHGAPRPDTIITVDEMVGAGLWSPSKAVAS